MSVWVYGSLFYLVDNDGIKWTFYMHAYYIAINDIQFYFNIQQYIKVLKYYINLEGHTPGCSE